MPTYITRNTNSEQSHKPLLSSRYFKALAGLKAVCVVGIFYWHFNWIKSPDLGARCCEIFFLVSGFLEGYRHSDTFDETFEASATFFHKKLSSVYPLHVVTFILALLVALFRGSKWLVTQEKKKLVLAAVYNLTLTQAWVSRVALWFNGASWFLSALMFCYLLTPCISWLMGKLRLRRGLVALFFAACLLCRIGLELSAKWYPSDFGFISMHEFPPVRLLEYAMAYVVGCMFLWHGEGASGSSDTLPNSVFLNTLLEIIYVLIVIWCVYILNAQWMRWGYVLIFMPLVWFFARERGAISRMLSVKPFQVFSQIELPFFMIHQPVIVLFGAPELAFLVPTQMAKFAVCFSITVGLCLAWKRGLPVIARMFAIHIKDCQHLHI